MFVSRQDDILLSHHLRSQVSECVARQAGPQIGLFFMRYNLIHCILFRLTRIIFPAANAHHNWVLTLLDRATPPLTCAAKQDRLKGMVDW